MCNNGLNTYENKNRGDSKVLQCVKGQGNLFDREMEVKHWTHPANTVEITHGQEDSKHNMHVYTDESKT